MTNPTVLYLLVREQQRRRPAPRRRSTPNALAALHRRRGWLARLRLVVTRVRPPAQVPARPAPVPARRAMGCAA